LTYQISFGMLYYNATTYRMSIIASQIGL